MAFNDKEPKWHPTLTYEELDWMQHILSNELYAGRLSNPAAISLHRRCLRAIEIELEKADAEKQACFRKK